MVRGDRDEGNGCTARVVKREKVMSEYQAGNSAIEEDRHRGNAAINCAIAAVIPGICAVFARIKDNPNKILILGMVSGFSVGISYVFGGRMSPIK